MRTLGSVTSRKRLLALALVGGTLVATTGSASGAIREVPQDFPTIQDAVDAANPGDTIAISKRKNFEHVTVATNNLLIRGTRPGVVVDGYVNGTGNDSQFDITANNVRIVNLGLRNGYGIDCTGERCAGKKLRYSGFVDSHCFDASGDRARITRSNIRNCDSEAIYISGDDVVVRNNVVRRSDSGCIDVTGDDSVVVGNRVIQCEDDDAIYLSGNRALAEDNFARSIDGNIVEISGDGGRIVGNRGEVMYSECFYLSGDRGKIRNNVASSCSDDGVYISGEDPQVAKNRLRNLEGDGIDFNCSTSCGDAELSDNVIGPMTEDDYGLYISVTAGTGSALIARNRITEASSEGIYTQHAPGRPHRQQRGQWRGPRVGGGHRHIGDDNTLIGNRVLNAVEDAFYISGDGNRLEENVARSNGGDGFQITVERGRHGDGCETSRSAMAPTGSRTTARTPPCARTGPPATTATAPTTARSR